MACEAVRLLLDPVKNKVRGYTDKLTQGQKAGSEIRGELVELIPELGTFKDRRTHSPNDKELIDKIEDVIRRAEDLVQAHEKMVILMNAATFRKVVIYFRILRISNQLYNIKPDIINSREDLDEATQDTENSSAVAAEEQVVPFHLRNYLHHCLLFPSGSKVPARRLIALWVAEGEVHSMNKNDQRNEEEIAEGRLNELVQEGVLVPISRKRNGKVKDCKIDDDKRVVLLRKAGDWAYNYSKKCRLVDRPVDDKASSPDRPVDHPADLPVDDKAGSPDRPVDHPEDGLVEHTADDKANSRDHSFVRIHIDGKTNNLEKVPRDKDVISFISFNTEEGIKPGELIGEFLRKCISAGYFIWLRVLDLEKVFRPNLTGTLGKLIAVKYLSLRWTYLEQLPDSVHKLFNLQVLDVKHTYISVLPRSIWRMQYLRHLYLSEAYRTKFPQPPSLSQVSLTALRTLWGAFVDDDTPIKGGLDRLLNIRKLGLSCRSRESKKAEMSQQLEAINSWIKELHHLESLRLKSRDENNEAADLHLTSLKNNTKLSSLYLLGILDSNIFFGLPASLTHVTLSGSKLEVDPFTALQPLNSLKILELLGQSVVCAKMHCSKGCFPNLEVLRIWKLQNVTELTADEGSLPCLKEVIIRDCPKLNLPDPHPLRQAPEFKLEQLPPESHTAGENTNRTLTAKEKGKTIIKEKENTIPETAGASKSQTTGQNTSHTSVRNIFTCSFGKCIFSCSSTASENTIPETTGANTSQTAGENTSQTTAEKAMPETAGASTSQTAGENATPKTVGASTSQIAGENAIPETVGASTSQTASENMILETTGENTSHTAGENTIPNIASASTLETAGENAIPDSAGENTSQTACENAIPETAGANTSQAAGENTILETAGANTIPEIASATTGENVIPETTGANTSQATRENTVPKTVGENAFHTAGENTIPEIARASTSETAGENAILKTASENTSQTEGENAILETTGANTSQAVGEDTIPKTAGENTSHTAGENTILEIASASTSETAGENAIPETAGENTSQVGGENTIPETAGENAIPETAGENTSHTAGEYTILETAGENTKKKFTAEENGKKVQL